MATPTGQISLQRERLALFVRYADNARAGAFGALNPAETKTKLDILEQYWIAFNETHIALADLPSKAAEEAEFNRENCLEKALDCYAFARAILMSRKDELHSISQREATETAHHSFPGHSSRRTLPEISLPTFSGNFAEWMPFRDLFNSMVTENTEISNVEKMHYLRTSLSEEAAQLISNLPVSGDSFASAWELLISRFENKRILVNAHLEKLFGQGTVSPRSARGLNALLNTTTEALHALASLDAPTDQWDMVLVYHLVQKLDPKTRESWEVKLGSSTEVPSYESLRIFLTGRARALESLGLGTSSPTSTLPTSSSRTTSSSSTAGRRTAPVKVHAVTAALTQQYPCSLCSGDHYIVSCQKYRTLSATDRRQFIISARLCFNCLGKHNATACLSSKRCQQCGNKHHTSIHVEDRPPPVMRVSTTPSSAVASASATVSPVLSPEEPLRSSTPNSGDSATSHDQA